VLVDGKPEEKTFDRYAQDKYGNVWYLGEDSRTTSTASGFAATAHGRPASTARSPAS
jgi:hypothetical protein